MPTIGELNVELSVLFEKVAPALATALQQLETWNATAQKLGQVKLNIDASGIKEGVQSANSLAKAFESVERAALHFGDALRQTSTDQKNLSASTSKVVSDFGQVSSSVSSAVSSLGSINSSATSASTALGSMAGDVARANAGLAQINGAASQASAGLSTVGQVSTQAIAGLQSAGTAATGAASALGTVTPAALAAARGLQTIPNATNAAAAGFSGLQRQAQSFQQIGIGLATVFAAPATGIGLSLKAFSEFDQALQRSFAVQDGITEKQKAQASKAALDVSTKFAVTAADTAKALYPLQSIHFTFEEQLKALPIIAQFSKAGLVDMSEAAKELTRTQGALGLASGTAAEKLSSLQHISDLIVKADKLSNTTSQEFTESLTRAAPVIAGYNISLEEGAALLARLAEGGRRGAEAATALGIILRDVSKGFVSAKSIPFFKDFGVEVFDAQGKMNPFIQTLQQVAEHLKGLSEEQKRIDLSKLFPNTRSLNTLLTFFTDGGKSLQFFGDAMKNVGGVTQEVQEKQFEAFSIKLELLKARVTAVAIQLGGPLASALLSILNTAQPVFKAIEGLVESFNNLNPTSKTAIAAFALITTGAGVTAAALFVLASSAIRTITAIALLRDSSAAPVFGTLIDKLGGLAAPITTAIKSFLGLGEAATATGVEVAAATTGFATVEAGAGSIATTAITAATSLGTVGTAAAAVAAVFGTALGIDKLITYFSRLDDKLKETFDLFEKSKGLRQPDSVNKVLTDIRPVLNEIVPKGNLQAELEHAARIKDAQERLTQAVRETGTEFGKTAVKTDVFIKGYIAESSKIKPIPATITAPPVFPTVEVPKIPPTIKAALTNASAQVDADSFKQVVANNEKQKAAQRDLAREIEKTGNAATETGKKLTVSLSGFIPQTLQTGPINAELKKTTVSAVDLAAALKSVHVDSEGNTRLEAARKHAADLKNVLDNDPERAAREHITKDVVAEAAKRRDALQRAEGAPSRKLDKAQDTELTQALQALKQAGVEVNELRLDQVINQLELVQRVAKKGFIEPDALKQFQEAANIKINVLQSGNPNIFKDIKALEKEIAAPKVELDVKEAAFEKLRLLFVSDKLSLADLNASLAKLSEAEKSLDTKNAEKLSKALSDLKIDPSLTDVANKKLKELREQAALVHNEVDAGRAKPEAAAIADEAVRKEASGENALKAAVDKTKGELKRLSDAAKTAVDDGTFQELYVVLNNMRAAMQRGDVGSSSTKDFAKAVVDFASAADIRNGIPGLEKINKDLEKLGVKKNDEGLQDQIKTLGELKRALDKGLISQQEFDRASRNVDRAKERAPLQTTIQDALKTEGVKSTLSLHIDTQDAVATWQDALSHIGDATGITQRDVNELWVKMIEAQARETGRLPEDIDSAYNRIKRSTRDVVQQGSEAFRQFGRQVSTILTDFGKNVVDILIPKSTGKPLVRETAAVADFAIQTGLSGNALESLVKKLETLTTATGGSFGSIAKDAAAEFKAWGIATKDQASNLDAIFATAVAGKTNFSELLASVAGSSATFQALGLNVTQAAALIAQLNVGGSDSKQVVDDLTRAYQDLTSKGYSNAGQALQQVISSIRNAGSVAEANAISIKTFGTNGAAMATLIRAGKLDVQAFADSIAKTPASVNQAKDAVNAFAQDAGKLNTLVALFNEVGRSIARAFVEQGAKSIATFITETLNLNGHLKDLLHTVVDLIGQIPHLGGFADILHKVGGFGSISGAVAPGVGASGGINTSVVGNVYSTATSGTWTQATSSATKAADEAGKAASQAGTAATQTAGAAGSAASSASSLLGTISQVTGIVTGIGTLISSVIGNFQQAAANKKLGGIQQATTRLDIATTQGSLSLDPELKGSQENLSTFAKASYLVQRDLRDRLESLRTALFSPVNETLESIDRKMGKLSSPTINLSGFTFDRLDGYAAQGVDYLKQIAASMLDLSAIVNAGSGPRLIAAGIGATPSGAGSASGNSFTFAIDLRGSTLASEADASRMAENIARKTADIWTLRTGKRTRSR